ncbi:MAG: hypothetical protein Q8884_02385, partial [Sweet potato little leaf phytoplasma]|nr:hypothetical protein [Sweet potato little leaf phytoplasma]
EKKLVAYHEAGHGVLAVVLDDIEKVRKITIIPRGSVGGYNLNWGMRSRSKRH